MANSVITQELLDKVRSLSLEDQRKLLDVIATLPSAKSASTPTTGENSSASQPSVWQHLSQLGKTLEETPCDLPEDLAANHDFYLHGLSKRS